MTRRAFLLFTAVLVRVIRGQGRASFAFSGKWPKYFFCQIFKIDDVPTIRMSFNDFPRISDENNVGLLQRQVTFWAKLSNMQTQNSDVRFPTFSVPLGSLRGRSGVIPGWPWGHSGVTPGMLP